MQVCVDQQLWTVLLALERERERATYVHGSFNLLVAIYAAIAKVSNRTGVYAAFLFFQFRNELHCAHLGRTTHSPCALSVVWMCAVNLTYRRGRWIGTHQIASCPAAAHQKPPKRGAGREKTGSMSELVLHVASMTMLVTFCTTINLSTRVDSGSQTRFTSFLARSTSMTWHHISRQIDVYMSSNLHAQPGP